MSEVENLKLFFKMHFITGLCTPKFSQDSFACSPQEISFTNSGDFMNINEVKLEPNNDYFSSPEICFNESTKKTCQIKINDYHSRLSFHRSLEESTQVCVNYYRKQ